MLPSRSGILAEAINKTIFPSNTVVTFIVFNDSAGNAQFIFFCNPPKSGASQVCITSLQITLKKILTKDIFQWLELITEILSFLQIFSVRKTTTQLLQYFRNSARISTKKLYFWHILGL